MLELTIENLLYVCTGNVFRSPVAERLTKIQLENYGIELNVESGGITKYSGNPLHPEILELTRRYGVDLSSHIPRQVNKVILEKADLILAFEDAHVRRIEEMCPSSKRKTHTIDDYIGRLGQENEDLRGKSMDLLEMFIIKTRTDVGKCLEKIKSS